MNLYILAAGGNFDFTGSYMISDNPALTCVGMPISAISRYCPEFFFFLSDLKNFSTDDILIRLVPTREGLYGTNCVHHFLYVYILSILKIDIM